MSAGWEVHMMAAAKIEEIVPKSDGPVKPLSVKFPTKTLKRIDHVAKTTGQNRSATVNYLVSWALDQWEKNERNRVLHGDGAQK